MDYEKILELIDARPFHPFDIDLVNGRRLRVDDPDLINIYPSRQKLNFIIVVNRQRDDCYFTWGDGIAALHVPPRDGEGSAAA